MKKWRNVGANAHICPTQNGITLIALVITIIVLFILAGISLNLVAGSNGILQRARNAVDTTNEKTIQEKLQLVMAELQMDYYAGGMQEATFVNYLKAHDVYNLVSGEMFVFQANEDNTIRIEYYGKSDKETADMELSFDLATNEITVESSNGEEKPTRKSWTVTYDANGGTGDVPASQKVLQGANVNVNATTTLTKQGYNFLGWALSNSATTAITNFEMPENDVTLYAVWEEWTLGTTAISAVNYGDKVNYSANGVKDWKVFLNDGRYVYIIPSNNIPQNTMPVVTNIIKSTTTLTGVYASDNRTTLMNWLTTSSYWSGYVNSTYAQSAMGGPTLPQWVQSWNAKGYETLYTATTSMEDGLTEYYVGTSANPTSTFQLVSSDAGYNDTLYYPDKSGGYSYWLASSSVADNAMMCVRCSGSVNNDNYNAVYYGVRPLVCLKSSVKMNWNGTAWDLSN